MRAGKKKTDGGRRWFTNRDTMACRILINDEDLLHRVAGWRTSQMLYAQKPPVWHYETPAFWEDLVAGGEQNATAGERLCGRAQFSEASLQRLEGARAESSEVSGVRPS